MENALYYTLSTVSQTLAGALGMLAAFLAIRVASLDTGLRDALGSLIDRIGADPAMKPPSGSTADILAAVRERLNTSDAWNASILEQAERLQATRAGILSSARRAFRASAGVMVACFVGLAASPGLRHRPTLALLVAAVAIAGGLVCLVWYGRIVARALED